MTRPIKKARVTRRRKYYGGGKKRGGTTLKKVGGGNKTRQIKRCRGSKKGRTTKRKVGGSVKESSTIKKNLRSYFDIPVKSIIDQSDDARRIGKLLGLHHGDTDLEARNVLADIIGPFGDDNALKSDIKILWPMIRSRVADFNRGNEDMNFNDLIDNFITNPSQNQAAAQKVREPLEALAQWDLVKAKKGKLKPVRGEMSRKQILNTDNLDFFSTHCKLEKIFFACFWEYNDVKNENEKFISLIVKAPEIINSRINFFKRLLSDQSGHIYTIQEDDFFSHLNPTSVEVMPSDFSGDSSGLYGTIKISDKKELGFIRQIKEVEKIEKIGEDNFITTNIKGDKKVKSSNVFQILGSLDELSLLIKDENVEKKWREDIKVLFPSFNNDAFLTFQKNVTGELAGVTEGQFIYKISDGVTIYYDKSKFKLNENLSKCGNNENNDPYVLAAFSTNTNTTEVPDFYVLTTHLESGRKSPKNELQRITGLNEILEEFQKLINEKSIPSNIPLIISMDANTPVYNSFYSKEGYYTAEQDGILLDSLEFNPKERESKNWLVNIDEPQEKKFNFLDGNPEWLVRKPDGSAIQPRNDTGGTVISVNKNRGFGTAQAWKMAADEYHLIDWLCIVNNKNSLDVDKRAILPIRKNIPNDLMNMLPTGYKENGTLADKIENHWPITDPIVKKILEDGIVRQDNNGNEEYSWFSDHLPLVATLKYENQPFNIVQNNVLSLWLGFDGFKGPNRSPDAEPPAPAAVVEPAPAAVVEPAPAAVVEPAPAAVVEPAPAAVVEPASAAGGARPLAYRILKGDPPPVSPEVLADWESLVLNFRKDDVDLSTGAVPARAEEKAKAAIRHFAWIVDGAEKKYEKLATTDEAAATQAAFSKFLAGALQALENVRKTFKNAIKNAIPNDKKMKEGREKLEDINYDAFLFSIAEEKLKAEALKQVKKAIVDAYAFLEELDMPSIPEQDSI